MNKTIIGSLNGAPNGILNTAAIKNSSQWHMLINLGMTLIRNDAQGRVIGEAAESWEISKDFKTFTFYLRDNLKDSRGNKLDSSDWKASFLHLLKSGGSTHSLISELLPEDGIITPNALTLELHLTKPYQTLFNRLTTSEFILVPKNSIKLGESIDLSISSGEYYVERISAEPNECVLRANHFHCNYSKDQVESVVIVPMAKTNGEALENLRNNKWHFYIANILPTDPSYSDFLKYRNNKEINFHFVTPSAIGMVILMDSIRLKSDTERRSLAKYIGQQVEKEFSSTINEVRVTHQLFPREFVGSISPEGEAEIFKQLSDDKSLSIVEIPRKLIGYTFMGGKLAGLANWAEKTLSKIGIKVDINDISILDYLGKRSNFDHDFLVVTTGLNPKDPAGTLFYLLGNNKGSIPDPDGSLNKLLNEATQADPEIRSELLQTISAKLTSTGRIIPLFHYGTAILSPQNIQALPPAVDDDELRLAEIRWLKSPSL
jgi:nickel transport system substrate-binding protein